MNNKVNYTFVGIVVLIVIGSMLGFVIWLMRPSGSESLTQYHIYFNESVSGLNINSPVKYRGVNVGKVLQMRISPKNYDEIEVLISVKSNTPVNQSTRATLNIQGITGLVFINLSLGSKSAPLIQKDKRDHIKTIQAAPSLFNRVEKSLGGVTARVSDGLDNLNKLLDHKNLQSIAVTLSQLQELMQKANLALDKSTITHFQHTMQNLDQVSSNINKMLPKVDRLIDKSGNFTDKVSSSMVSVANSYKSIQGSMGAFEKAINSGEFNLKDISQGTLKNLNMSLDIFDNSLLKFNNMLKTYQNNPSSVLFESREPKKGPGER
jgi:phospholipid/cholesterol/gamma-HCH transport system substrate-binding protein